MKIIICFSPVSFLYETSRCVSSLCVPPQFFCYLCSYSASFLSRLSLCLCLCLFPLSLSNRYCICMCCRITLNGMKVSRPDVRIGRYRMIKHERDKHNEPNPQRYCIIVQTRSPALHLDRSRCFCLLATQFRCFLTFSSPFERIMIMWRCKGHAIGNMSL